MRKPWTVISSSSGLYPTKAADRGRDSASDKATMAREASVITVMLLRKTFFSSSRLSAPKWKLTIGPLPMEKPRKTAAKAKSTYIITE